MVLTVGYPAVSTRFALSELQFSWHEALAAAAGHRAPDGLQQNKRKTPPELLSYALLASHIYPHKQHRPSGRCMLASGVRKRIGAETRREKQSLLGVQLVYF
jgi:hypothetical protein